MGHRIRVWRGVAGVSLLAAGARAQVPALRTEIEASRAAAQRGQQTSLLASLREDLASDDPVRIAWAAYDAGRMRVRELAQPIVAALERTPGSDLGPLEGSNPGTSYGACAFEKELLEGRGVADPRILRRFVPAVLLDALVELDATAPAWFLENLLLESVPRDFDPPQPCSVFRAARGPALALFARHPSAYPHLADLALDLVAGKALPLDDALALIAADACVATDPKKLAERWLALPEWRVSISVFGGHGPVHLLPCGGCFSPWTVVWPDRMPPPAIHHFSAEPTSGSLCLFDAPVPLFWRRDPTLVMDALTARNTVEVDGVGDPEMIAFAMLRGAAELDPDPAPIRSKQDFHVLWRDADTLLAFAREKRGAIEEKWNAVVAELIFHFRLDGPLPSRYPPRITIEFIDDRGEELRKAEPLPVPP